MKALICGLCVDIRALPAEGEAACNCGNARARWVDSARGTAAVSAYDQTSVRIMGIHNGFLKYAFDEPHPDHEWRNVPKLLAKYAENSLFAADRRACPVVIFRVGETSDVWWEG